MKKRPLSMFSRIKNSFGQMEASAEQKEMGNVRQKKKYFVHLKHRSCLQKQYFNALISL